jgi:hypothetical protein
MLARASQPRIAITTATAVYASITTVPPTRSDGKLVTILAMPFGELRAFPDDLFTYFAKI